MIDNIYAFYKIGKIPEKYIYISLKVFFHLLFISTLISSLSIILLFLLFKTIEVKLPTNNTHNLLTQKGIKYYILVSCILAPIFEEIGHRLFLKKTISNIAISSTVLFYFLINTFLSNSNWEYNDNFYKKITLSIFLGAIVYYNTFNNKTLQSYINKIFKNNTKLVLWGSVILFSFSHITNFNLTLKIILFTPLITLPQTVLGLTLCYTRLTYGIVYSVFLHATYNLISTFLFYTK